MKVNSGEIIKKIRSDLGLSQEEMAQRLFVSPKKISRIEGNEVKPDIWQLMSMLELLGYPSEDFWMLYLDTDEYEGYRTYRLLKRQLWDGELSDAITTLESMEQTTLVEQPCVSQFIALAKVILNNGVNEKDAVDRLYNVLSLSIPDFCEDKIHEYRLTYNEIYILNEIASEYGKMGDKEKAVKITEAMIKSREHTLTSEEDRAMLFPALMFNLSNYLGQSGRAEEALKVCNQAIEICRKNKNLTYVPHILLNIASCYHILGEQEHVYKTYLVRAYHAAYAFGENELAQRIKMYAEEDFGIRISDL